MAPAIEVSAQLEHAVLKCLEKKPDDRFASVAEFYESIFGEPLPRPSASALRSSAASTGLDVRLPAATPSGGINTSDFNFGPGLTGANATRTTKTGGILVNNTKAHPLLVSGGAVLLLGLLALGGLAGWYLFVFNGPADDRGPTLQRYQYTYYLWQGDQQMHQQNYREAEADFKIAEYNANKFGDNFGRLMNVYRAEMQLFKTTNQYDKLANVVTAMTEVGNIRSHKDLETALAEVNRIKDMLNKKQHGLSHLGKRELELQLSAVIDGIRDTAGRLGAVQDYEHQETLLGDTISTYSQLVGDDDAQLAALNLDLAKCHVSQDEFDQAKPLFRKALEIYTKVRGDSNDWDKNIDVAHAMLKLGQFDRDRSNFKEAGPELLKARDLLKRYGNATKDNYKRHRGAKLLVECLNALADYSDQTGNAANSKKYRDEAAAAKKLRDSLPVDDEE